MYAFSKYLVSALQESAALMVCLVSFQLFSIIVVSCVSDRVIYKLNGVTVCAYNDSNACNFSIAIAIMAFLICLVFLIKDVAVVIAGSRGKKPSKAVSLCCG